MKSVCLLVLGLLTAKAFNVAPTVKALSRPCLSEYRPMRIVLQADNEAAADGAAPETADEPVAPSPPPAPPAVSEIMFELGTGGPRVKEIADADSTACVRARRTMMPS